MKKIVEQKLGIPPDYQYKAINSKNFLQANWHQNKFLVLKKYIRGGKNKMFLDLGPGSGNFESLFAKKFKKVVAIDYNDEAVAFLKRRMRRERIKNVTSYCCDIRKIESLKLKKIFDGIVMVDVIEHIKIEDGEKLLNKVKKNLKRGGRFYIITPNYISTWLLIESLLDKYTSIPKFNNEQHLAKYHSKNLRKMFESAGFVHERSVTFNLFSYLFPNANLAKKLLDLELKNPFSSGNLLLGIYRYT